MSDLLSPILYVMQNEVDAFWCFVGFMDKVASNFELEQGGMKRQLGQLTLILKYLDLPFYNYLGMCSLPTVGPLGQSINI